MEVLFTSYGTIWLANSLAVLDTVHYTPSFKDQVRSSTTTTNIAAKGALPGNSASPTKLGLTNRFSLQTQVAKSGTSSRDDPRPVHRRKILERGKNRKSNDYTAQCQYTIWLRIHAHSWGLLRDQDPFLGVEWRETILKLTMTVSYSWFL